MALANNPGLAERQWDAAAALADEEIARARRWPELRAEAGYSHFLEDRLISPRREGDYGALGFTDDLLTGQVLLKMPLYTGGRLLSHVAAAQLLARAAGQRHNHSKEEVVFNVSSVFYSMLGQQQVLRSLLVSREALNQHHRKTLELIATKKAATVDALRTEVRLADVEQQLLREQNVLEIQRLLLASLLGLERVDQGPQIVGALEPASDPPDLSTGLAVALARRQDYLALQSGVNAQREQIGIARAERWPTVSFVASYGNSWALDRSDTNEVGEVGVKVGIPLFDGGRIGATTRREDARFRSLQQALRKLELQIRLEVGTSTANIHSTRARVDVTHKAVAQAEESLRIEQEKYGLGKGVVVDVLDAQSALLKSQTNYHCALADYNTALAQFRLATGCRL
jgi:outer membrane protein TolC